MILLFPVFNCLKKISKPEDSADLEGSLYISVLCSDKLFPELYLVIKPEIIQVLTLLLIYVCLNLPTCPRDRWAVHLSPSVLCSCVDSVSNKLKN